MIADVLTEMKVPGRKNNVTRVMILMETVSSFVLCAMACISRVIASTLSADSRAFSASSLFASMFSYCRMPWSLTLVSEDG